MREFFFFFRWWLPSSSCLSPPDPAPRCAVYRCVIIKRDDSPYLTRPLGNASFFFFVCLNFYAVTNLYTGRVLFLFWNSGAVLSLASVPFLVYVLYIPCQHVIIIILFFYVLFFLRCLPLLLWLLVASMDDSPPSFFFFVLDGVSRAMITIAPS